MRRCHMRRGVKILGALAHRAREIRDAKGRVSVRAVVRGCGAYLVHGLRRSERIAQALAAKLNAQAPVLQDSF
jgi:hypothetical protein